MTWEQAIKILREHSVVGCRVCNEALIELKYTIEKLERELDDCIKAGPPDES